MQIKNILHLLIINLVYILYFYGVVFLLVGVIVFFCSFSTGFAESHLADNWSSPILLYEYDGKGQIREPFIISDQTGSIHVFWNQYGDATDFGNRLFYTFWDGLSWSYPVDIIASESARSPSAAIDSYGNIHLLWSGPNNLAEYSWAPVNKGDSAIDWSNPINLVEANSNMEILADQAGKLNIVYPGIRSSGVYYSFSKDNGDTWSYPVNISLPSRFDATADYVRIAISPSGILHVVWTEYELPNGWPPLGIFYSRSKDFGATWSNPVKIAGEGYDQANIAIYGENFVHIAWNGMAGVGGRYHCWSSDGGKTWSKEDMITPFGYTEGPPQLVFDSAGILHFLTTYGQRVWYSFWNGQRWAKLMYVPSGLENGIPSLENTIDPVNERHIEQAVMAISNGNKLNIVFWDERLSLSKTYVWYVTKTTSASEERAKPFPTKTADAVVLHNQSIPYSPLDTTEANSKIGQYPMEVISSSSANRIIFTSLLPIFLLLLILIFVKIIRYNNK